MLFGHHLRPLTSPNTSYLAKMHPWLGYQDPSWVDPPEKEDLAFGEVLPPDVAVLARTLVPHEACRPMNLMATSWICPGCMEFYIGSCNYICNLPIYKCKRCNIKNPTAYDWTLIRSYVNGISVNFLDVYDQDQTSCCVLFAFISLCDMMRRLRGAKYGCDEGREIDFKEMRRIYKRYTGVDLGEISEEVRTRVRHCQQRHPTVELILEAGVYHGVPYSVSTRYAYMKFRYRCRNGIPESSAVHPAMKVTGWFRVSGSDIDKITRLLASGFPLLAVIRMGKRFKYLAADQIYRAPKESFSWHAVVIHGSGLAMPQGEITPIPTPQEMFMGVGNKLGENSTFSTPQEVFFRARNSYGNMYHVGIEEDGGADFCFWASDITGEVYGIYLDEHD